MGEGDCSDKEVEVVDVCMFFGSSGLADRCVWK